jgi:hypothetical protein
LSEDESAPSSCEVREHLAVDGMYDGAIRNRELDVAAISTAAVLSGAWSAIASLLMRAMVKVQQGVNLRIYDEDDVATPTTVAAIRATERLELLTVDRCTAVTAISSCRMQNYPIYKTHHVAAPFRGLERAL